LTAPIEKGISKWLVLIRPGLAGFEVIGDTSDDAGTGEVVSLDGRGAERFYVQGLTERRCHGVVVNANGRPVVGTSSVALSEWCPRRHVIRPHTAVIGVG